jgi:chromosomal replication initiator protein
LTDKPLEELAPIWEAVRSDLRASVLDSTFELWLAPLQPAALRGDTLYLTAPAAIIAWIERRYASMIASTASRYVAVRSVVLLPAGEELPAAAAGPGGAGSEALSAGYTFDRFVIGAGGRTAHAASLAVAESPGEAYNPLFLFGPPGLGKTHLLGAIANYTADHHPDLSVRYTTAERFTADFVGSLRVEGSLEAFKRRHREIDVLLIDDVQFLAGKVKTADEFFHTFNALYEGGSQIVLSSDRPPAELNPLADRLRDRFEWGMLAELTPPDLPTRQVIVQRLAREAELPAETAAALESLAAGTAGNVRRLEGALTRLIAHSSIHGRAIDHDLAASVIHGEPAAHSDDDVVERIKRAVGRRLGIEPERISSSGRAPGLVRARQLAIYLSRELTELSLPQLGLCFGRDHSTVLHAIRKVERDAGDDANLAETIHSLRAELAPMAAAKLDDRDRCENRQPLHRPPPQAADAHGFSIHSNPQGQSQSDEDL